MQAFNEFLSGTTATPDQIEFIELVVQELTLNGVMEADRLFQSPFTDVNSQGPLGLFPAAPVAPTCCGRLWVKVKHRNGLAVHRRGNGQG